VIDRVIDNVLSIDQQRQVERGIPSIDKDKTNDRLTDKEKERERDLKMSLIQDARGP
jgi:hypothetical protein